MASKKRRKRGDFPLRVNVEQLRQQFVSAPFDDSAAEDCGQMRAHLAVLGTPLGPNDLTIAAIALANGATAADLRTKASVYQALGRADLAKQIGIPSANSVRKSASPRSTDFGYPISSFSLIAKVGKITPLLPPPSAAAEYGQTDQFAGRT
jgi:hypothetical protein